MSHVFRMDYVDLDGSLISSATTATVRLADIDNGYVFDFADSTWKATTPTTATTALTEDTARAGSYVVTLDESTWGNRQVEYQGFLAKSGESPLAVTKTRVFLSGAAASPSYTPSPPSGTIAVIYYVRDSENSVPSSTPTGYLYVMKGAGNPGIQKAATTGDWDGSSGALSWSIPEDTEEFKVIIPSCGEYSYWYAGSTQIVLNTNTTYLRWRKGGS